MLTNLIIVLAGIASYLAGMAYQASECEHLHDELVEAKPEVYTRSGMDIARVIELHTAPLPVVVTPVKILDDEDPLSLYDNCGIVVGTR
jgi:hypothetical protein